MKFRLILGASIMAALAMMLVGPAFSQDQKSKMSEQEMMAAYAIYATPGPQHKMLDPLVGSWDCTAQMWNDPGVPPTESKATCETKWILGGRFTQDDVTGDMGGMPFHGMGINGYDNFKKEFVSFWIDEMGTSFTLTSGQSDASGKVITMNGSYPDPAANMQERKFKTVTKIVDNDHHVYEMYNIGPDGKDVKTFAITYVRKK